MHKLISTYKILKDQLTENVGDERSECELMWNEGILEAINNLFIGVPKETVKLIKLNHI